MIIALAGRPNVGKSSIFNRLLGRRKSLVWDQEGVTRDIVSGPLKLGEEFEPSEVWDLAGYGKFGLSLQTLPKEKRDQLGLILFVVDGSEPLTSTDIECAQYLRKLEKPVVVIVNKSDKKSYEIHSSEIWSYFTENIVFLSAEEKKGLSELETEMLKFVPRIDLNKKKSTEASNQKTKSSKRVAILGRPNVGKSSLFNGLIENTMSLISDQPGTTRDVVEGSRSNKGIEWIFCDTAGIRKKPKVYGRKADPIEIFSIEKSLKELKQSDFALLVIEARKDGSLDTQDRKLLHLVRSSLVPTILVVNKWDLVRKVFAEKDFRNLLRDQMGDLQFLPVLFTSAKSGYRVDKIFQMLRDLDKACHKISTPKLNRWLQEVQEQKPPRVAKRGVTNAKVRTRTQYLRIHYLVQTSARPMSFQFFCNAPQAVAEDDKRFLANQLRRSFNLQGLPIRFTFRKKV